ncbi:MAG TPA: hypothetical protein VF460_06315 [Burkholderiales bacterium]
MPNLTLFIPSLMPPAPDGSAGLSASRYPALERLLARGHASSVDCAAMTAWLCGRFGVGRQLDWPGAPIALQGEGEDPGREFWFRATPVHLRVQRDQLVLLPPALLAVTQAEAQAMMETLNRHFSADGLLFTAPHPQRWYLRTPAIPELHTVPLDAAIGRDINRLLPTGGDRMRYHHLFNEMQMLLHDHAVNESRERSDLLAINSIWFWEGGTLPAPASPSWRVVIGDDPLLKGLGRLADIPVASLSAGLALPETGDTIVVLPESPAGDAANWRAHMEKMEQEWIRPILQKLRSGEIQRLEIVTVDSGQARGWAVASRDLLKFWKPVAALERQLGMADR